MSSTKSGNESTHAEGDVADAVTQTILCLAPATGFAKIREMEIRIREAGIGDLEHMVRHRRSMFAEMGYRDACLLERVEDISREYFKGAVRSGAYQAWMGEDEDGQVVGGGGIVMAAWPGYPGEELAERAWILNMYTEPRARRRGVAKRLLETMIERCRMKGFSTVSLHASDAGRPLYELVGFQPTNEMTLKLR